MAPRWSNPFVLGTNLFDPTHRFETSWLLPTWTLLLFRILFALFALFTRLFIIIDACVHSDLGGCLAARHSFSYFTILTFWGLLFYFVVASVHTLSYMLYPERPFLDRFPRILQAAHSLYYTTIVCFPPLVTIVYWAVLYSGFENGFQVYSNVSQHAMNSAMAMFEIIFPRTAPMPWIHLFWLIIILLGYLAIAFITLADQHWYVYDFLDYSVIGGRGIVAAYVIGIAVAICLLFLLVKGMVWLRRWATEKTGKAAEFPSTAEKQSRDVHGRSYRKVEAGV